MSPNLAWTGARHPCSGRASSGSSPAPPKCRQTSSHRTARKPIYFPHLKKVIKCKGRSYLFFYYTSPELSNSLIKSQKHLMKAQGWRQRRGGEWRGAAPGLGRCCGDASEGKGRVGPRSPTALLAGSLVAAAAEKETQVLSGGRFGKSKAEAAGSGWAPKQTAHQFKQPFAVQRHPPTPTGLPS